ncbi:MAG TPA: peptide chain release factor-like protein [Chitinispirillaceae bacterium]|nr:peptide chain release factor-like protein [Chitinispirillaceae bacterium]
MNYMKEKGKTEPAGDSSGYKPPVQNEDLLEECYVYTFRAGGKGGQHVNKTDSAVRLVHKPTGLTASCSRERSQYLNKKQCLENLRRKIGVLTTKPVERVPTKIPASKVKKRLKDKSFQAVKKNIRRDREFFE